MMRTVKTSSQYKRDLKRRVHDKRLLADLTSVIATLAADIPLAESQRDHDLIGDWLGCRECHIRSDCVLIYQKYEDVIKILKLMRVGSHSELFK